MKWKQSVNKILDKEFICWLWNVNKLHLCNFLAGECNLSTALSIDESIIPSPAFELDWMKVDKDKADGYDVK